MRRHLAGIHTFFSTYLLFPFIVRSAILLTVEGDAILDVLKTVSYTRSATDPETFLLVNVVLDAAATQGTQQLVEANGASRGTSQVIAHFPGFHHVLAFLNVSDVAAGGEPLAKSNAFGVNPATTSLSSSTTQIMSPTTAPIVSITTVTVSPSATPSKTVPNPNTPAIAGGVVSTVFVLAVIMTVVWYFCWLPKRRSLANESIALRPNSPTSTFIPRPLESVQPQLQPQPPVISVTKPSEYTPQNVPSSATNKPVPPQFSHLYPNPATHTVGRDQASVDASSHVSNSHSGNSTVTTRSHSNNTISPITVYLHVNSPPTISG